ncbi:hypothetical protein HII31_11327 [Pseudocercospora fuligena]|uniref:Uncharacterized protein n=1 Tax=Pseudocercospora fuligena TaxID=685502 RepID=A0A8H6VCQ6_9PEZI|nr:hypothetical protein HII31_11327 [Pseudocercospora fuligena]
MVRLTVLLLPVAMLIHATTANPPSDPTKLSNIFQVDMRDPAVHSSSCRKNFAAPNNPSHFVGRPIFDPSMDFLESEHNILNYIWHQMHEMVWFAQAMLEAYPTSLDIAQLAYSFWGIKPGKISGQYNVGMPQGVYLEKYNKVMGRYQAVQNYMETARPDGPDKFKILCGGEYLDRQDADSWYRDKWGRTVDHPITGDPWKLAEWEELHGRDFDAHWYFWYDIEEWAERGYFVVKKDDFDWALNPVSNKWDACTRAFAANLLPFNVPADASGGTDSWYKGGHLLLCDSGFAHLSPYDGFETYPLGTTLESVGITAITFLHEIIHVVYPDDSWDMMPWLPLKEPNVATGTVSEDWPWEKSAFDQTRYRHDALGPLHAWSLAMYELAEPETLDINQMVSWRTPEVYAWFGRAANLMALARQDWSTGVARDLKGPFVGPTALPPQAKRTAIPGELDTDAVDTTIPMRDFWTTIAQRLEASNMTITARSR